VSRVRCFDQNFRDFCRIFGEKIGVFLKKQCNDPNFTKIGSNLDKKCHFFENVFGENILKIITSVPDWASFCLMDNCLFGAV
jgi:hypothetical protein